MSPEASDIINTEIVQNCPLCGSVGQPLYDSIRDHVFGTTGQWSLVQCSEGHCELLWLSPRPTIQDLPKAYKSYYTHTASIQSANRLRLLLRQLRRNFIKSYVECRFGYIEASAIRKFVMGAVVRLFPAGADAYAINGMFLPATNAAHRLIEVGCGNGSMLTLMRDLGWEVNGLEFDPTCKQLVEMHGISCSIGDLRDQHYPDDTFDAIYTGNVIEHLIDPHNFVAECARVLKTGGRFVALTPNSASLGHAYYKCDWRGLEPPRHLSLFNLKNLSKLLLDNGFEIEIIRTTNRGAWYIFGMSKAIRKARLHVGKPLDSRVYLLSISGLIRQFSGRLIQAIFPARGEEILVVAVKKRNVNYE